METLAQQRRKASKPLLWIGIGSIIMAFAGLTSGYVVSRTTLVANEQWITFALPSAFMYSTIVMLLSSAIFGGASVLLAREIQSANTCVGRCIDTRSSIYVVAS